MAEAEGGIGAGTEGTPKPSFEERIRSLIEPSDEGKTAGITNSSLIRLANLVLQTRNQTPERLTDFLKRGDDWFADGRVPEEEWPRLAGEIQAEIEKLRIKAAEAEPEIKKLERPKTAEEAVKVFLTEIFDLHERGLREGKSWEKTGELWSEFTTLQRWVADVDPQWGDEFRNKALSEDSKKKDEEEKSIYSKLEGFLARQYPEGIRLREKLSFLLEAMKRLHNRQIEVVRAEGGLVDLGVIKGPEGLAPQLKPPFTNLRPIDWWVLTHIKELFPESENNLETVIDVKAAWDGWQAIGKQPGYEWVEEKERKEEGEKKKWRTKKIKINDGELPFRFENIYKSDVVMANLREKIARKVGRQIGNDVAGVRAESLAHSILTVSLTFDMWDRERWKQKGKQEARDLMWFEWKRAIRLSAARPAGPLDTVGCFWFPEDKNSKLEEPGKKDKKLEILRKNRKRSLFKYEQGGLSEGTIIGDFFHSTTYIDEAEKPRRLADVSLTEIPWLKPGKFEEETYDGYFGYSMFIAAQIEENISKLGWKPEDLLNRDFWVRLTDLTVRLDNFCPWLVTLDSKARDDKTWQFRRILARGMFWTGSYLAQPNPNNLFTVGAFSKDDVYGESLLGMKRTPGILDAIGATGYLDEENLRGLRREIYDFNFHLKGRKGR